ncbi:hypothetical protein [Clostridium septicum]|uniref:hypothetical protein n=1 Tax=Clostridium septicum TaxID=1504 RepID=UPI00082E6544|nr:hypothetical protein [Clostridium septicum]
MLNLINRRETPNKIRGFNSKNKHLRGLIVVVVSLVIILNFCINLAYLIAKANHECNHDRCDICLQIKHIVKAMDQTKNPIDVVSPIMFLCLLILFLCNLKVKQIVIQPTLISLKVRLDR